MEKQKLDILYCYIYRNIKKGCCKSRWINSSRAYSIIKRIVHTAPKVVYNEIIKELEIKKLIKISGDRIIILTNRGAERQLAKLKEYVFPFNPYYYKSWT